MPHTTLLYDAILALVAIAISMAAGTLRARTKIPVGDGGNKDLLLAMRRHGNFVENVPLALIVIGLLELNGASSIGIHLLGAGLVVFRISHALGLRAETMRGAGRLVGAAGTMLVIVTASIWSFVLYFSN